MENSVLVYMLKRKNINVQFVDGRNAGVILRKDFKQAKNEKYLSIHFEQVKTITEEQWRSNSV